ncbi:MAG TPA: RecX family transcriptional regulator [Rubellimicrobium sp.]|jgi:regulatory protein|nr:RecX family transcriptional regulator [Rubellimicrobium sp.]
MADQEDEAGPRQAKTRKEKSSAEARPLTEARIRNIAEHYVGQRESSAQMLRQVLERRLVRRLRTLGPEAAAEEREAVLPLIEAEVARLQAAGVIEDARYAEMKARSALSSGRGSRRILRDLGQKGVTGLAAQQALLEAAREVAGVFDDAAEPTEVLRAAELEAAEVFARKRRLGPYRAAALPEARSERSKAWSREAAAMARAGFSVDTIRKVLDREPEAD